MQILKTYEILRMIDEDPKKMIGKRFKQIGGLVSEEFGIGDIAVVTKYHNITSLGAENLSRIRITLNGFEEWQEAKQPVTFMEAIKALEKGESVYCEVEQRIFLYKAPKNKFHAILGTNGAGISTEEILHGKWYID